jgi:hypothetical protein
VTYSAEAMELVYCMMDCYDSACVAKCESIYPAGVPLLYALEDCMDAYCSYACGGSSECGLTTTSPACDQCMNAKCNTECVDAVSHPEFIDWLMCAQNCNDDACFDSCSAQYPTGAALLYELMDCLDGQCYYECY